jgi:hypothetical protein
MPESRLMPGRVDAAGHEPGNKPLTLFGFGLGGRSLSSARTVAHVATNRNMLGMSPGNQPIYCKRIVPNSHNLGACCADFTKQIVSNSHKLGPFGVIEVMWLLISAKKPVRGSVSEALMIMIGIPGYFVGIHFQE